LSVGASLALAGSSSIFLLELVSVSDSFFSFLEELALDDFFDDEASFSLFSCFLEEARELVSSGLKYD